MERQFKKFQPMTQVVNQKINELLNRGGTIILEKKEFIEINECRVSQKLISMDESNGDRNDRVPAQYLTYFI
jgi:hypothetical protein